jgi:hypothetical protein
VQFRVDFGQEKLHLHELGSACEGSLFLCLYGGVFVEEGYVAVEEASGFFVGFVHGPLLQFGDLCRVVFLIVTYLGVGFAVQVDGGNCGVFGVNFGQAECGFGGFSVEHHEL